MVSSCALSQEKDSPKCCWEGRGSFSVKSMYFHLCSCSVGIYHYRKLWKIKVPLKVKIFMWLVQNNSILTRDNLTRRGWQGDARCAFCSEPESVNIFSLTAPRLVMSGVWWRWWLMPIAGPVLSTSSGNGQNLHAFGGEVSLICRPCSDLLGLVENKK